MRSIWREPLLHFLLLGAALFVLFDVAGSSPDGPADDRIVVTRPRIGHLAQGFARTWQRPPTPAELEGLIDDHVREEVLYREALALGLEKDDTIIRRRLRQKLEFLTDDVAAQAEPTDEELRAFLDLHAERFRQEPEVAFRQVFLDRDLRGAATDADARALLDRLEAAPPDVDLAELGDVLMVPHDFERTRRSDVDRQFGDGFADRLLALEPGRWTGPIVSGYGAHLVLLHERVEGRLPELEEIRDVVAREWHEAGRKETSERWYRRLLEGYTVEIDRSDDGRASGGTAR